MTTLHNLVQKAEKRRRQIFALNAAINAALPYDELPPAEKRVHTIAMRNLKQAMRELEATEAQIQRKIHARRAATRP